MECKNYKCSYIRCSNTIVNGKICRHCLDAKYCSNDCRDEDWKHDHSKKCNSNNYKITDFIPVKKSKSLGKGAYGEVQLVQHLPSRQFFALKIIKKRNLNRSNSLKMMYREISVQKKLIHPNIIRLFGHIEDIDNLQLILEYAEKGNLFHYIRRRKHLTEEESFFFFTQVCIGILFLHENSIIHRDLKPENILITQGSGVKICDFGWCAEGSEERNTYCGTLDYMAPEILKGSNYSNKVDIWALGILLYEMTHGYPPFSAKSDIEKSRLIRVGEFQFNENISKECQALIKIILQDSPDKRPSLLNILKHPWVAKYMIQCYSEKINFSEFVCGNTISDSVLGKGIIVNSQGLVCEVSFSSGVKELLILEIARKNENLHSSRSTRSSQNLKLENTEEKEFELKLSKDYPPSYKQSPVNSRGKPPRTPIVSIPANGVFQRKMNSEEDSGYNSTGAKVKLRSESSKMDNEIPASLASSSSQFSSSSEDNKPKGTILTGDVVADRLKELEDLQKALEGNHKRPIPIKRPKKPTGFFARLSGIFNIGCTER